MTETIQTAMDRLMTISVEPQDYVAEDGLLYCGSCNTPKEAFFPNGRKLFGRDRHPAECQCRQEARKKQEEEERARLHHENVRRLKLQGFTEMCIRDSAPANQDNIFETQCINQTCYIAAVSQVVGAIHGFGRIALAARIDSNDTIFRGEILLSLIHI